MPEQSMFDYDGFAAYCADKKKWDKDRALREAYEWCQQADLIRRALETAKSDNVALATINDLLVDLVRQSNMAHLLAPEAIEQSLAPYLAARLHRLDDVESIERQGMELNANLAATTAVSEKQKHAASHPRSRSDDVRNPVIKAMRTWRRRPGVTLDDFIAAHADSTVGIRISNPTPTNGERYTVDRYDDAGKKVAGKQAPLRTLQGWWTSAGKLKLSKR